MDERFKGIFAALVTPYTESKEVSYTELKKLVRHLIKEGVNGFYVGGSTGEAFLLSHDERKKILETVLEENAGERIVIAHVGCIGTDLAVDLAKHAESVGADAVSSIAPFYYKYSQDEICDYYDTLANATNLPLLVYNFPSNSGFCITKDILNHLRKSPQIVGIKHTSTDLFSLERMKSEDNNLLVYNGFDEMLLAGLVMGADGGIGSTYNCMPQVYIALRNAFLAGDYHKAQKLQMLANNMIEAMVKCGVFASVKYILDLQGFNMNGCRKPFASLTEEQKVLLSDVYKGFLQDLVKV